LNLKGEAVGVNAAISSPTGSSVGIGFAIPIDFARAVVPDLIAHGSVSRGWLGVVATDVPKELAEDLDISGDAVVLERVEHGSPAARAGLKPLDVLVEFNGEKVHNADDFRFQVAAAPANAEIEIEIIRSGNKMTVPVVLGDRTQALQTIQSPRQMPYSDDNWLGMTVTECNSEIANRLGVECPRDGGVIVTEVSPGSPAYNRNIVPGVIIIEIDKYVIKDINDYRDAVAKLKDREKSISFIIYDTEGNTRWVGIKPTP
jgi:serine protease Do